MKKGKEDKAEEILSEKNEERKRAIDAAMGQIEKQFGKGSIMRLGANSAVAIPVISTGSLDLDIALGIGGLPVGRIVEIYGPESSGKTTLMLSTIAQAQKKGGIADLLVSQPDNGEEALEICESLVRSNAIDIIVIDSVAALVPKAEIEGDMGDSHMGLQARLMSQALRKLTGTISKSKTTVVFINQIRMKIGVMFGSPETTTGGNALKFYASVRLDIRKIETLKDKEDPIGNRVRVKVVKNKCAPPFKQAEFDVMFNSGINRESSIIDLAVKHEIIVKGGSWYSYNGEKIGQGKETVRAYLQEHPDLSGKLEAQIRDLNDLPPNGSGVVAIKPTTENGKGISPEKAEKGSRRNMALEEELESAEAAV